MFERRVVLDTNIYISIFAFGGRISRIFELAQEKQIKLYISKYIVTETKRTLIQKFKWPKNQVAAVIDNILTTAYLVEPSRRITVIKVDPSDNRILECAVSVPARILISGDSHLLKLNHFEGIEIMTPRNFLDLVE